MMKINGWKQRKKNCCNRKISKTHPSKEKVIMFFFLRSYAKYFFTFYNIFFRRNLWNLLEFKWRLLNISIFLSFNLWLFAGSKKKLLLYLLMKWNAFFLWIFYGIFMRFSFLQVVGFYTINSLGVIVWIGFLHGAMLVIMHFI